MSYYKIQKWFGYFKYKIEDIEICNHDLIIKFQRTPKEKLSCPICKSSNIQLYGIRYRKLRDLSISKRIVYIVFPQSRIYCSCCGVHTERISFADPYARHTRRFERFVHELCHYMTVSDVSRALSLSWDEARYIDQKYLAKKYRKPPWKNLRIIGVDEIALEKGHKYLTVVVNLVTGQIIYACKGRDKRAIENFFYLLGPVRCWRIKGIVMDMWSPYISAAEAYLPKAKIVFDKFHIIAAYHRALEIIRKYEYSIASKKESHIIKSSRYLLLKNKTALSEEQKIILYKLLTINANLNLAYILKDDLTQLWSCYDKREAETLLNSWIQKAYHSQIPVLMSISGTFLRYKKGILNYFDMPITAAKVEGINNKIKVLKRKAYGFRNIEYFTLKMYDLHNLSAGFV